MAQKFEIVTERELGKRLADNLIWQQLQKCAAVSLKGTRGQGWAFQPGSVKEINTPLGVKYRAVIKFSPTNNRTSVIDKWPRIVKRFAEAGCAGSLRKHAWKVVSPEGFTDIAANAKEQQVKAENRKKLSEEPKVLGDYSLEPDGHFQGIFGREPHVRRVLDAYHLAHETHFQKRTHCLFDGPPGCGKSHTMLCFARMLGEEGKAWLWFDATSMTKAGVIEHLMESSYVPGFLFIEEIEKCPEESLRWLLGVMDVRGVIRRTNYRVGNQARNVRMVVTATANDVQLLKRVMSGALYSRFQNKIYFPPPDREVMKKILEREVAEMKGDVAWIEPALEFGFDKWGITDPRDIITICTCGRGRLLTGKAQSDYEKTMHPSERKYLLRCLEKRKKNS